MSNNDQLKLLVLQEEVERLRELISDLEGDPHTEAMRQLVQEADRTLQEAERLGAAAGLLAGPLPWWEDWQRRNAAGSVTAPGPREPPAKRLLEKPRPGSETPLTHAERCVREGRARIARQKALLERLGTQDHPLLPSAQNLLHALMRAQLLAKARLLMLRHFNK